MYKIIMSIFIKIEWIAMFYYHKSQKLHQNSFEFTDSLIYNGNSILLSYWGKMIWFTNYVLQQACSMELFNYTHI